MRGKETISRLERGERIPSRELHAVPGDYFFRTVIPLVLTEEVTRQKSLGLPEYPPDIYYQLVKPLNEPSDEEVMEHLAVYNLIASKRNLWGKAPTDAEKLTVVRDLLRREMK